MASGTINGSTGNEYIDAKVVWSSVAYTSSNKSSVTAALYYKRNNTGYTTYGTGTFSITINGIKSSATKSLTITEDAWVKAVEATVSVSHNDNGSKSISISASGSMSGTTLSSTSVSGTVTLDTIPRASTIDSLSCATKYFTGKLTYKYTPKSASYYNRCNISLNLDGEYIAIKSVLLGKKSASQKTATITFAEDELSTIYNELPKTTKGTLRFTFRTYSDSDYSTQIGDAVYKEITLSIPNNSTTKPTVTMELAPVTSLDTPFDTLYIKGRSKVDATFTDGEGKYGASVVSYKMKVGGKSYGSPYTSGYLSTTGDITITGIVTDSRGFSREYTETITVISYSDPKILPASDESEIVCARCDEDGNLSESGIFLKIKARRSYYKVTSDGVQNNFCAIRYRYRDEGTNTFSSWKTILAKSDTSTNTIDSEPIADVVSSAETAYVVQVGVIDDIGESDAVQFIVPSDFVSFDMPEEHKGRKMAFFRYVGEATEDGLYVGLPIFGGSIDSLKLGTRLTATSTAPISLNDVKTPGCYYSPSAENSQYIADTPYTGGGFGLEVRELQSTNYIRQTIYYGRTTWLRHWNGTEWSGWIRYLMTDTDTSHAVDFVIEEGTSGIWEYRKWKSGFAECWGVAQGTRTFNNAWGNLFVCSSTKAHTYPFEFVERPTETATIRTDAAACFTYAESGGNGMNTTTQTAMYCGARPTEVTDSCTLYIDYQVKGRWK